MKKTAWMLLTLLAVLLTGCAGRAEPLETVNDTLPPVASEKPVFSIAVTLPPDVVEQTFSDEQSAHVYEQQDGAYEVVTEILYNTGVEQALRSVTGRTSEQLTVLKTERFSMPEYRTSWYTASDEGGRVNRASILFDGAACYCVSFSAPEEQAADVQESMEEILGSIRLDMEDP